GEDQQDGEAESAADHGEGNFRTVDGDMPDMNAVSDADALRASAADPARFGVVYERHVRRVHGYLRRRVGDGPAEDLCAEVFARAFRGRARYDARYETALPW